jgi:4-hydroxybenzoate polyprenyltransferase
VQKSKAYLKLARPHQYLKNGFIWLPLFFGHKLLYDAHALCQTAWAFVAFCLAASSIYVFNDVNDIQEDRRHPIKRFRPLAVGILSKNEALAFMAVLLGCSMAISLLVLPPAFTAVVGGYLMLNVLYTCCLKHLPIIDVVCIAVGFVLRIFAGGVASDVHISQWIVMMTFLMAVFLALSKRSEDLHLADNGHGRMRKSLDGYNAEFVSLSMVLMAAVTIVAYILYTVSPDIVARHGSDQLYMTGFWVIIGFLRYMQITFVEKRTGSPTMVLIKDYFLQGVIGLWLVHFFVLLY